MRIIGAHVFEYFGANIQEVEVPRQRFERYIQAFEALVVSIFCHGAVVVALVVIDFFHPVAHMQIGDVLRAAEINGHIILIAQTENHIQQVFIFRPSG